MTLPYLLMERVLEDRLVPGYDELLPRLYTRPPRPPHLHNYPDGFKVNLEVHQFRIEELKVRLVDEYVVVEGRHDERLDQHGFVARQFTRRYRLPQDVDPLALVSHLSSDGILTLYAPKKAVEPSEENVREIPIIQTNTSACLRMEGEEQPPLPLHHP